MRQRPGPSGIEVQPGPDTICVEIRVRGRVQGVGFRPAAWRHARALGLGGIAFNDGEGVLIRTFGAPGRIREFIARLEQDPPPLAAITAVEVRPWQGGLPSAFEIGESRHGSAKTEITPDAAICADCAQEIFDPAQRRHRYPFTTCTQCGPRLSILRQLPYDRSSTSMAPFVFCIACAREYADPADRRFHAETLACQACGPKLRLIRFDGVPVFDPAQPTDDVGAAAALIRQGEIVAIKGLGGYQLACDATSEDAVTRLRALKQRDRKPFALMARNIEIVRRYCRVSVAEETVLRGPAGPIVLLQQRAGGRLPNNIAPGLNTLGFMLPTTPLHALLLADLDAPLVMTSGNTSQQPQVISDAVAQEKLSGITPFALVHDREIVNRVDDSVVRVAAGLPRLLRRGRGYAPAPLRLPAGFEASPPVLAMGGDLKSVFCLTQAGSAVLSPHIGDLDDLATQADFRHCLDLHEQMLDQQPQAIVVDLHPHYRSAGIGRALAAARNVPLIQVQHHHAHIASCLSENGWPLEGLPVLGIALDGLGFGVDGNIWGAEFLLADYRRFERLASFRPVAMPGGDQASLQPWRNLYAQLSSCMGWPAFSGRYGGLQACRQLDAKPRKILDAMLRDGINCPEASSCGRLFDAVAAALGICFDNQGYEGEAAARLEACADLALLAKAGGAMAYPFLIRALPNAGLIQVDPSAMWDALFNDLAAGTAVGLISARFHGGLASVLAAMALRLAERDSHGGAKFGTVALSGGCFHNAILLEQTMRVLQADGFAVLSQALAPAGDGGLALGQAAIASAQLMADTACRAVGGNLPCASAFPDESSGSTMPD